MFETRNPSWMRWKTFGVQILEDWWTGCACRLDTQFKYIIGKCVSKETRFPRSQYSIKLCTVSTWRRVASECLLPANLPSIFCSETSIASHWSWSTYYICRETSVVSASLSLAVWSKAEGLYNSMRPDAVHSCKLCKAWLKMIFSSSWTVGCMDVT